jgi:hypothetical protein
MDMPFLAHVDPTTGKSTHTNFHHMWVNDLKSDAEASYKRAQKAQSCGKGGKGKEKNEESTEDKDEDRTSLEPKEGTAANTSNPIGKQSSGAYHTFLDTPTARVKKSTLRTLNAAFLAVPQYVKWSEKPCTFDKTRHK